VKIDYHIHTLYSDGRKTFSDYIDQAGKKEIDEIGFSDHVHFEKASWSMDLANLPKYLNEIHTLKCTSKISVKAGLEVDFIPSKIDGLMQIVRNHELDYLMGSVHHIGDWLIDSDRHLYRWKDANVDQVYKKYFALVQEMAESKLFDTVGHLDLTKKFGFRPKEDISSLLLETVEIISKSNMCVEVNTGGLRKPCHEMYPSPSILKMCFDNGVPVTLGSDAHQPEDVGADFEQAVNVLRKTGYTETVRFDKRTREIVEL
jgi:histidinol-phosphatase (PHP family)